ncbi:MULTISPECIES: aldo/keto reductase family protein [Streptomyces]|uniref:aldo/keto reductase family protein n=1 Tax=Streptomyces TaxID=1883 RepID=UPI001E6123BB|nr:MULTISPECIES: aldo/keto reductase family protein [Streptomyces]UFQ13957.1 aldo/keto reductase family protein [Streptomyces huasconensis]WCL83558.1 aldo/keto reductase family protein [Streptomyces sp. JCM 35825]
MKHRSLGRSGLKVSEIAYGSWISYTEGSAERIAREAVEQGITTFDTADVYGGTRAEVVLGRALQNVRRESVEISTKVFSPIGPGPNDRGLSRKHIMEAAHGSLRRLGIDYIDLYQAHRFDEKTPLAETLRAFDDLIRQGKVLYVGVSEWTAAQISEALELADRMGLDRIVSNQPQYNLVWRVIEEEVVPLCEREGIGQLAWSPLAQGLLTGKYLPGTPPPAGSRATGVAASQFASKALSDNVLKRVAELGEVASDLGLTMPQLSIAWVLRNPNVSSAIVGATKPEQIAQSAAASGVELDDEAVERIDRILGPIIERDPRKTPSQPTDYGS